MVMVVAAARVPVVMLPAVMEVTTLSVKGGRSSPKPPASLLISSEMAATVPSALVWYQIAPIGRSGIAADAVER